jgi:hypothetical protein
MASMWRNNVAKSAAASMAKWRQWQHHGEVIQLSAEMKRRGIENMKMCINESAKCNNHGENRSLAKYRKRHGESSKAAS